MKRKPYQLSSETRTKLADLLQLVMQTGQLVAHSACFRLFSFNSVMDFKKDFGVPNYMLLPPGLHRGRSFTVSLKAHASQLIGNKRHKLWEIEPGDTASEDQYLWLDRSVHKSLQALTQGIQRLTDYVQSIPTLGVPISDSISVSLVTVSPNTNILNNTPYVLAEELTTQLMPLFALLVEAGQLVEHTADFNFTSFNLPSDDDSASIPDDDCRSYHLSLDARLFVTQGDRIMTVWELNPRRNELGHALSFYPDYERSHEKLQSAMHRLQDYLRHRETSN